MHGKVNTNRIEYNNHSNQVNENHIQYRSSQYNFGLGFSPSRRVDILQNISAKQCIHCAYNTQCKSHSIHFPWQDFGHKSIHANQTTILLGFSPSRQYHTLSIHSIQVNANQSAFNTGIQVKSIRIHFRFQYNMQSNTIQ
jgi:hypothetical protein